MALLRGGNCPVFCSFGSCGDCVAERFGSISINKCCVDWLPSVVVHVKMFEGGHGCLVIPFARGVCGAAARTGETQLVPDVEAFAGHIACASSTRSELVLPVWDGAGELLAVLDIDSNQPDAFTPDDAQALEGILQGIFSAAK